MSAKGTARSTREAKFVQLIRALVEAEDSPGGLYTRSAAARRLGVTSLRLRQMLFFGQLTRVKVLGRERIFL